MLELFRRLTLLGLILGGSTLLQAYGAAAERNRTIHEADFGDYVIRLHGGVEPEFDDKLEILRHGRTLFTATEHRIQIDALNLGPDRPYDAVRIGEDLTGDGRPNLVVRLDSGGAHCCATYLIFEIGERFRLVSRLYTGDYGIAFRDLDDVPGFEIETQDATFAFWKAPFVGSPAPRVVLAYRDGQYRPAPDLMRASPMPNAILSARAERIRDGGRWDWDERYDLDSRLWAVMLDLI